MVCVALYVGIFGSLPASIGRSLGGYMSQVYEHYQLQERLPYAKEIGDALLKIERDATTFENCLFPFDVVKICSGFVAMAAGVFCADFVFQQICGKVKKETILQFKKYLGVLATITKVGCLLICRICGLPMTLGFYVLYTYNMLAQYPKEHLMDFMSSNVTGSLSLVWAMGISFMLLVTLNVLQVSLSLSLRLIFKGLFLYTRSVLRHVEWFIRQLYNTTIILYNITSLAYSRHTDD